MKKKSEKQVNEETMTDEEHKGNQSKTVKNVATGVVTGAVLVAVCVVCYKTGAASQVKDIAAKAAVRVKDSAVPAAKKAAGAVAGSGLVKEAGGRLKSFVVDNAFNSLENAVSSFGSKASGKPIEVNPVEVSTVAEEASESVIHESGSWKGYGKQNYYWNQYVYKEPDVIQYKCNRYKFFDNKENTWETTRREVNRWDESDPNMPEWIRNYL